MSFNPQQHIIKLQGRDYLPVMARVAWYRDTFPNGRIDTDFIMLGDLVIAKTVVTDNDGNFLASGSATVRDASERERAWTGRIVEKAETAAIGRALANAGFGTLTADDEGDYLADNPQQNKPKPQSKPSLKPDHSNILDGAWNEAEMGKFWGYWNKKQGIASETILAALGIEKLSQWGKSLDAADSAMKAYIEKIK